MLKPVRLLSIVVLSVLTVYVCNRYAAATPSAAPPSNGMPTYAVGDTIELYLDRSRSDNKVSISGRLEGLDEQTFCVRSRQGFSVGQANGKVAYGTRDVLQWVPRSSVLFVEKIEHEDIPATQPG